MRPCSENSVFWLFAELSELMLITCPWTSDLDVGGLLSLSLFLGKLQHQILSLCSNSA